MRAAWITTGFGTLFDRRKAGARSVAVSFPREESFSTKDDVPGSRLATCLSLCLYKHNESHDETARPAP